MPNGIDKNFVRLTLVCAAFRERYGSWPTEARVAPIVLWDFGQLFDGDNFERLCARLKFRTTARAHIAVGTASSHLVYRKTDEHPDPRTIDAAGAWLGVRVRPELHHLE